VRAKRDGVRKILAKPSADAGIKTPGPNRSVRTAYRNGLDDDEIIAPT